MNRTKVFVTATALLLMAMCTYFFFRSRRPGQLSIEEVNVQLEKDLKFGNDRSVVEAYLDRRGIPHSYKAASKDDLDERGVILAMLRDPLQRGLIAEDFQLHFWFTPDGKLIGYKVEKVFTGP